MLDSKNKVQLLFLFHQRRSFKITNYNNFVKQYKDRIYFLLVQTGEFT